MSSIRRAEDRSQRSGFSILEVLIAITVLAVGLSAMALLASQTLSGTERARFMALATTLASEKLEDLSRYPATTPAVAALTPGGSLTADTPVSGINYYDDVDLSNTNGQVAESYAVTGGYSTIVHQATGEVDVNPSSSTPVSTSTGTQTYHRRWLIEASPTVGGITLTGSRRITVVVTLTNQSFSPPISYQMSMVRP